MTPARRSVAAAGLHFSLVDTGPTDTAAVLLLLHGGTETAAIWMPYLGAFTTEGWRVVAPDSRGHGATLHTDDRPLSYELMADDMADLLDAVGVEAAAVIGFSDGANIALELARRHPARTRAVVLHGLATQGVTPAYRAAIEAFFRSPFGEPADLDAIGRSGYGRQLAAWHSPQGPEGWRDVVRLVEPLFNAPPQFGADDFSAVTCPALVVTGDRDPFMPLAEHVATAAALPGGELAVWPGVGHDFPARPALFTDLVLDFLARRGAPQTGR